MEAGAALNVNCKDELHKWPSEKLPKAEVKVSGHVIPEPASRRSQLLSDGEYFILQDDYRERQITELEVRQARDPNGTWLVQGTQKTAYSTKTVEE